MMAIFDCSVLPVLLWCLSVFAESISAFSRRTSDTSARFNADTRPEDAEVATGKIVHVEIDEHLTMDE